MNDDNIVWSKTASVGVRCDLCGKVIEKGHTVYGPIRIGPFVYNFHAPWEIEKAKTNYLKNVQNLPPEKKEEETPIDDGI